MQKWLSNILGGGDQQKVAAYTILGRVPVQNGAELVIYSRASNMEARVGKQKRYIPITRYEIDLKLPNNEAFEEFLAKNLSLRENISDLPELKNHVQIGEIVEEPHFFHSHLNKILERLRDAGIAADKEAIMQIIETAPKGLVDTGPAAETPHARC